MGLQGVGTQAEGAIRNSEQPKTGSLNGRTFTPSRGVVMGTIVPITTIIFLALFIVPMSLWIAGATQGAAGLVLAGKISLGIGGGLVGLGLSFGTYEWCIDSSAP